MFTRFCCLLTLSVGLLLVQSQAAWSAEAAPAHPAEGKTAEAHQEPAHHGEHAHIGTKGVSEDPSEVKTDLAIYSFIVFLLLLAILYKSAWGPICEGLEKREQFVLQNIADAESARLKAEKLLADHTEKLDKVQNQVREMLAEAHRDAEHTKSEIIATAQQEAELTKARAVAEINRARDVAIDSLFEHMSKAVAEATEQVLGRSVTSADEDRLIQDALRGVSPSRN